MAAGHLVASLGDARRSPVLAVGSAVVDRAPTWFKNWAVSTLGSADKPVLLVSVSVVTLLLAAGCGLLALRSRAAGSVALATLGVIAGAAVITRPDARATWLIPSAVTIVVGVGALLWLLARARPLASDGDPSRREFLGGAVGLTVVSGLVGFGGEYLRQPPDVVVGTLPKAATRAPAIPVGLTAQDRRITALRTPNPDFYRVDTALTVPDVDASSWRLSVVGVPHPFTLTYAELLAMPLVERDVTLVCVSNEVGGDLAGGATWLGVRTRDLLVRGGLHAASGPEAMLLSTSVDGFTVGTPLAALFDDRDALVAVGMNGELLPRSHGYPARLLTPGLYGMVGATKWLTRMEVTTFGAANAYWQQRGWSQQAPIKEIARIDLPRGGDTVRSADLRVGGIAWAPRAGVAKVQVRFDFGPWQDAQLGPEVGVDFWRQWLCRPSVAGPTGSGAPALSSGQHNVEARVIDAAGHEQSPFPTDVYPSGATGYQRVTFTLT